MNSIHQESPLPLSQYAHLIDLYEPFVLPQPVSKLMIEQAVHRMVAWLHEEKGQTNDQSFATMDYSQKRRLLKALLTVRPALPILPALFHKQMDVLLQYELDQKKLIDSQRLPTIAQAFPDSRYRAADKTVLWQGDITTLKIDAYVNAANSQMQGCFQPFHACIDNVIHSGAGPRLREDCHRIMQRQGYLEGTGWAKITRAYNLPAKFVIHTVGPIVPHGRAVSQQDQQALASAYRSVLNLAAEAGVRSVAFCCISTGVFGFPQQPAAEIATNTVATWLEQHPGIIDRILFNVFKNNDLQIYQQLLSK